MHLPKLKNRSKVLQIKDEMGTRNIFPGDSYIMTTSLNFKTDRTEGKTEMVITFFWDGKLLTRVDGHP